MERPLIPIIHIVSHKYIDEKKTAGMLARFLSQQDGLGLDDDASTTGLLLPSSPGNKLTSTSSLYSSRAAVVIPEDVAEKLKTLQAALKSKFNGNKAGGSGGSGGESRSGSELGLASVDGGGGSSTPAEKRKRARSLSFDLSAETPAATSADSNSILTPVEAADKKLKKLKKEKKEKKEKRDSLE